MALEHLSADRKLVAAVRLGDLGSVESLLHRGADPNTEVTDIDTSGPKVLWHLIIRRLSSSSALKRPRTSVLLYDLEHARDKIPTQRMCRAVSIARVLIAHGADPNCLGPDGASAFGYANRLRLAGLEVSLIEHGLTCNQADGIGRTPLMVVSSEQAAELLLRRGAAVDSYDDSGFTALDHAVMNVNPNRVRLLLRHGAHFGQRDRSGAGLLHELAEGMDKLLDSHWKWADLSPETKQLNSDAITVANVLLGLGFNLPTKDPDGYTIEDDFKTDGLHVDHRAAEFISYVHRSEHSEVQHRRERGSTFHGP